MAWRFYPGETLPDAFSRTAAEEIGAARAALLSADFGRDEAIHVARRSFKRLRALLRLAHPALGPLFAAENRRWRDAGRLLAGSRDAAVRLKTYDDLVDRGGRVSQRKDIAELRYVLLRGSQHHDDQETRNRMHEVVAILDAAEPCVTQLGFPKHTDGLHAGLRASQKSLRRAWKRARRDSKAEHLHEWRKRVKDFSAQMRLFRAILPDNLKGARDDADELAELLGLEHDLSVLCEWLSSPERSGQRKTRELLLRRIEKERGKLCRSAFRKGEELSERRPRELADAVTGKWTEEAAEAFPPVRLRVAQRGMGVRRAGAVGEAGGLL